MRVLQLIDSLEAGGAERMAVNLANALVPEIDKSYLCTTRTEGLLKSGLLPEVSYLFLKRSKTLDLSALKRLGTFVKAESISVVHAHASSYFMATQLKLIQPKIAIIWHDHYGNSEFLDQRPKHVLKCCSYFFKAIITVNEQLANWDTKNLLCKQVQFLPNFVAPYKSKAVTQLKGEAGKRILCLANLRKQKDHITLLKAFKSIIAFDTTWTLHCVGKDFNDDYAKQVKAIVQDLKLENQVFFYGSCPDTNHLIKQANIGVLASASEGLPLALLEYGQGGLAVVATNVGDCSLVIPDYSFGTLVPASHTEALANAILEFIKQEELRKNVAKVLQNHIAQNFSQDAILKCVLPLYSKFV